MMSSAERTEALISGLEARAAKFRDEAASVERPSDADVLVAKRRKAYSEVVYSEVQQRHSQINADLTAIRDAPRPFWNRRHVIQQRKEEIARLTYERANLITERIAAEKLDRGADGNLRIAEKAYGDALATVHTESARLIERGAQIDQRVARIKTLVNLCPSVGCAGPEFVRQVLRETEDARKKLRNPWALDIWGIPIPAR